MPTAPLVAWDGRPADATPRLLLPPERLDRIEARRHRAAGSPSSRGAVEGAAVPNKEFSDVIIEFAVGPDGKVAALKQIDPSGEFVSPRQ